MTISILVQSAFLKLTEDIKGDQVNFGVSVLSGFGSGHIDDLACLSLDHNELIFTKGRALLWVGKGGSRTGLFELIIFVI